MKTKNVMKRAMLFAWTIAAMCVMPGCLSDGEETYVLEEPQLTASKMIIGEWRQSTVKAVDEDGNDVPLSSIEGIDTNKMPDISFGDDGNYTTTDPDGTTETGSWNISDDDTYLNIGEESWKIYSFGENKLVLVKEIYYNGRYYYIMYIFIKVSSTEVSGEEGTNEEETEYPKIQWSKKVSKIIEKTKFNDSNNTYTTIYTFEYDIQNRVSQCNYNDWIFTFTYNDAKVDIECDGELLCTGTFGTNGYLSKIESYRNEEKTITGYFTYTDDNYLSSINVEDETWTINQNTHSNGSILSSIIHNNGHSQYTSTITYNGDSMEDYSIDINQLLFYRNYNAWETAIFGGADFPNILGLFDFCGKRVFTIQEISTSSYSISVIDIQRGSTDIWETQNNTTRTTYELDFAQ